MLLKFVELVQVAPRRQNDDSPDFGKTINGHHTNDDDVTVVIIGRDCR